MRTSSLIIGTVLACGLAFAGRSESVVYTDGNLTGIATHAKAVLDVSQDKAMKLRVGRNDVTVPYGSIKNAETTADTTTVAAPGKKASPAQLLTVEFMSLQNEPRTMTLQMSKDASAHVLTAIRKHSAVAGSAPAVEAKAADKAEKPAKAPKSAKADKKDKTADKQAQADQKDQGTGGKQAKADQKKADKSARKDKKKEQQEVARNEAAKAKACAPDLPKDCSKGDWWGDNTWKTTRNLTKWEQQSPAPAAQ